MSAYALEIQHLSDTALQQKLLLHLALENGQTGEALLLKLVTSKYEIRAALHSLIDHDLVVLRDCRYFLL